MFCKNVSENVTTIYTFDSHYSEIKRFESARRIKCWALKAASRVHTNFANNTCVAKSPGHAVKWIDDGDGGLPPPSNLPLHKAPFSFWWRDMQGYMYSAYAKFMTVFGCLRWRRSMGSGHVIELCAYAAYTTFYNQFILRAKCVDSLIANNFTLHI